MNALSKFLRRRWNPKGDKEKEVTTEKVKEIKIGEVMSEAVAVAKRLNDRAIYPYDHLAVLERMSGTDADSYCEQLLTDMRAFAELYTLFYRYDEKNPNEKIELRFFTELAEEIPDLKEYILPILNDDKYSGSKEALLKIVCFKHIRYALETYALRYYWNGGVDRWQPQQFMATFLKKFYGGYRREPSEFGKRVRDVLDEILTEDELDTKEGVFLLKASRFLKVLDISHNDTVLEYAFNGIGTANDIFTLMIYLGLEKLSREQGVSIENVTDKDIVELCLSKEFAHKIFKLASINQGDVSVLSSFFDKVPPTAEAQEENRLIRKEGIQVMRAVILQNQTIDDSVDLMRDNLLKKGYHGDSKFSLGDTFGCLAMTPLFRRQEIPLTNLGVSVPEYPRQTESFITIYLKLFLYLGTLPLDQERKGSYFDYVRTQAAARAWG